MHKLIHNMTMCIVLCHLLAGCCWHHAHAAEDEFWHHARGTMAAADAHTVSDEHGECVDHRNDQPDSSGRRRTCHEGHCVFVVPVIDGTSRLVGQVSLLARPAVTDVVSVPTSCALESCRRPLHKSGTPLRLHLLNQILLI
jgi:hypothetical protein